MNQRIETERDRDTIPNASSAHMAIVMGIAARGQEIFKAVGETSTMGPDDQADVLGRLLDELDDERARIVSARDSAHHLAEIESLLEREEADEERWNAANNGGMP
jgi:hypothetical protein